MKERKKELSEKSHEIDALKKGILHLNGFLNTDGKQQPGHKWAGDLKRLIEETNKARTEAQGQGKEGFDDSYIGDFFRAFNQTMLKAIEENKGGDSCYGNEERKLINQITDCKDNYFAWVTNLICIFASESEAFTLGSRSKVIADIVDGIENCSLYFFHVLSKVKDLLRISML